MPRCSRCHRDWPADAQVCPADGTPLHDPAHARTISSSPPPSQPLGVAPTFATPAHAFLPTSAAAAQAATELSPGTDVGEYRIVGKLGEGGMGTVYAAVHPLIGKKAAIKVISPELCTSADGVERFVQEARAVNQIGHPNIVDIFA